MGQFELQTAINNRYHPRSINNKFEA
uniref:Uncharacterized protein n=1 Tax=Arundo donax TaxID=35708 RepID=A0A0A8Y011_ARUDO